MHARPVIAQRRDLTLRSRTTSDTDRFDSGDQPMGNVYEFTFTEPGVYPYCLYHGDKGVVGMAGTIIVE